MKTRLMSDPTRTYLDFERPVAELDAKIEELESLAASNSADVPDVADEIAKLRQKSADQLASLYEKLDPWRKTQVARHPERPHFRDYRRLLIEDFEELCGDRRFSEDPAIVGGIGRFHGRSVVVMGHEKGRDTQSRLKHNFGMARPEGYRKAIRLMDMAEKFNMPVLTFVDTAGAYPGVGAEERGQAEAIARSTERCLTLGVPLRFYVTQQKRNGDRHVYAMRTRFIPKSMLEHFDCCTWSPSRENAVPPPAPGRIDVARGLQAHRE